MWTFHGNLWAKGDTFWGISYLKAHPLGNPTYTRTVDRIRSRGLGDPSDPKGRMVPLYHGLPLFGGKIQCTRNMLFLVHLQVYLQIVAVTRNESNLRSQQGVNRAGSCMIGDRMYPSGHILTTFCLRMVCHDGHWDFAWSIDPTCKCLVWERLGAGGREDWSETHLFRQMTVNGEPVAMPEPHDLNHVSTSHGLHPVLALNIHGCITLIGASGFVVMQCLHRVDVWVSSTLAGAVDGLCGPFNTDLRLWERSYERYNTSLFPLMWLVRASIFPLYSSPSPSLSPSPSPSLSLTPHHSRYCLECLIFVSHNHHYHHHHHHS
ncbi:hypothetical protein E2C01_000559 [Portunus trituberculatus]|uniref:Uncharacterized protein n=1 Tax=Portunus trituberculatus TaxID=210409 RepID=A0A5B7CFF7_PORTR|nr:hypothetical protein [Portunus trituberculatus]